MTIQSVVFVISCSCSADTVPTHAYVTVPAEASKV